MPKVRKRERRRRRRRRDPLAKAEAVEEKEE